MSRLDNILREVDEFVSSRGQEKTATAVKPVDDNEVTSLIAFLNKEASEVVSNSRNTDSFGLIEKIAHHQAIAATISQIDFWSTADTLEKMARSKGVSEEKIAAALGELAKKYAPHLAAAGVVGVAGASLGKKYGETKGYNDALNDVDHAMRARQDYVG